MIIIINLISALLLTEIVEFFAAYLLGHKGKNFYRTLALVNVITNPLINYIILVLYTLKLLHFRLIIIIILEIIVIFAEWGILSYAMNKKGKSFLALSIIMNTASFLAGVLISGL